MAQQARPNVMGHNADFRAQLNTQSIDVVMIPLDDSTTSVVCFAIQPRIDLRTPSRKLAACATWCSGPLERTLPPCVIVADYQDSYKDQHLGETKQREPVVDDRPREQKNGLNVKNEEQNRYNIKPDRESLSGVADWIDAAFVRQEFLALVHSTLEQPRQPEKHKRECQSYKKEDDDWDIPVHRGLSCRRASWSRPRSLQ